MEWWWWDPGTETPAPPSPEVLLLPPLRCAAALGMGNGRPPELGLLARQPVEREVSRLYGG